MHKGQLKCVGSPLYLKKQYGVGYTMVLSKDTEQADPVPSKPLIKLVKESVPEAKKLR